jgi:heat shock protein HtpX
MQAQPSLDQSANRLEHNVLFLGVLAALVVGGLVMLVQPIVGALVAAVLAVLWFLLLREKLASSVKQMLSGLDLEPLSAGSNPQLENLLEGLCATSGVTNPEVYLLESTSMNALVAANKSGCSVILTTQLAEGLGRLELEGVVANLLGRQRDGSARYATSVISMFGSSGYGAKKLAAGLGEQRSVRSDMAAIDLTRYPPGLISAFSAMQKAGTTLSDVPANTAPMWIAPVAEDSSQESSPLADTSMQPLTYRIAVLQEL